MHAKARSLLVSDLHGVEAATGYDRIRRLVEANLVPRGARGQGTSLGTADVARYLMSWLVSHDAKASPPLVEQFWTLRPSQYFGIQGRR